MKYSLSKREKTLLYSLLCIVLVVAGWYFLLEPSLRENSTSKITLSNRQSELMGEKVKYQEYSDAPLRAEEEKQKYASKVEGFYGSLSSEEIDKLLTELVLRNNLIPDSLNIDEVTAISISEYSSSIKKEENQESAGTTENDQNESMIKGVKVSLSVHGPLAGVQRVSDEIATNKGLKLTNFNYVAATDLEEQGIVLNFIIYMIEK